MFLSLSVSLQVVCQLVWSGYLLRHIEWTYWWYFVNPASTGESLFETRREYILVGSDAASLPHTVSKRDSPAEASLFRGTQ